MDGINSAQRSWLVSTNTIGHLVAISGTYPSWLNPSYISSLLTGFVQIPNHQSVEDQVRERRMGLDIDKRTPDELPHKNRSRGVWGFPLVCLQVIAISKDLGKDDNMIRLPAMLVAKSCPAAFSKVGRARRIHSHVELALRMTVPVDRRTSLRHGGVVWFMLKDHHPIRWFPFAAAPPRSGRCP